MCTLHSSKLYKFRLSIESKMCFVFWIHSKKIFWFEKSFLFNNFFFSKMHKLVWKNFEKKIFFKMTCSKTS